VRTAHLLGDVGRGQASSFTAELAALHLRPKQFALLNRIDLAQGSSQQELSRSLELDPSGLVSTVDDLEEQGLVERQRDPADRRRYALYLTESGRGRLADARTAARRVAQSLLRSLSDEQVAALAALLETIVAEDTNDADRLAGTPAQVTT